MFSVLYFFPFPFLNSSIHNFNKCCWLVSQHKETSKVMAAALLFLPLSIMLSFGFFQPISAGYVAQ